jgi:hypothetical protein
MDYIPVLKKLDYQKVNVEVGTGIVTPKAFRDALVKHDCNIDESADEMLNSPGFLILSKEMGIIPLALITNRQLGLDGWATAAESLAKALEWGLEEIISEVGLQFCLQTTENEWQVFMGMRPVINSRGVPKVLSVSQSGKTKWLGAISANTKARYPGRTMWAFKIPFFK